VTSPLIFNALAIPWVKVVFPAPSSPSRRTQSPAFNNLPSLAPKALVSAEF
jgi:VanZ family protein